MGEKTKPRIIDYGESTYRQDFWEKGREYEDMAERVALRRLLPPEGERLLEIGAGFGRLVPLYQGYREVVLLDYSESLLQDALNAWGAHKFRYVAANWYNPPFADGAFDAVVTVRVLHHAEDLPALLGGIARILAPGGVHVLEFANKRNLKAIARYVLRRQDWNPFSREPVEFHPLHWDFHPRWMESVLHDLGFAIEKRLTVSHFRAEPLKRLVPARLLAAADAALQWTGRYFQFTPSVLLRARAAGMPASVRERPVFRCTGCGETPIPAEQGLNCACGQVYPLQDGILNFKNEERSGKGH